MDNIVCFVSFIKNLKNNLYSYRTILSIGLAVFFLIEGMILDFSFVKALNEPGYFGMSGFLSNAVMLGQLFMLILLPLVIFYSVLMSVSNVVLLKKEGRRIQNILGIITGPIMFIGSAIGFVMIGGAASADIGKRYTMAANIYSGTVSYFECMLIGSVIC